MNLPSIFATAKQKFCFTYQPEFWTQNIGEELQDCSGVLTARQCVAKLPAVQSTVTPLACHVTAIILSICICTMRGKALCGGRAGSAVRSS